jgi:hypothetical protein
VWHLQLRVIKLQLALLRCRRESQVDETFDVMYGNQKAANKPMRTLRVLLEFQIVMIATQAKKKKTESNN